MTTPNILFYPECLRPNYESLTNQVPLGLGIIKLSQKSSIVFLHRVIKCPVLSGVFTLQFPTHYFGTKYELSFSKNWK